MKPQFPRTAVELGFIIFFAFLYFCPQEFLQALGIVFIWVYLLKNNSAGVYFLLAFVSLFPLVFSPSALDSLGVSLNVYYGIIQCSPFYLLMRLQVDPWSGAWVYEDSPFHFGLESLVNFWGGVALSLLLLTCWVKRRFASH